MKQVFALLLLLVFAAPAVWADNSLYMGPNYGSTSLSTAVGGTNRSSETSYGLQSDFVYNHWAAGLSYEYFSPGQDGSQAVNVTQGNQWLNFEGRFRIWNQNFSPYVSVGGGAMIQQISTSIMGVTEQSSGTFFVQDLGIGFMGHIAGDFGANLSARYYQFSNVNGFDYTISIGFFPTFHSTSTEKSVLF